MKSAAKSYNWAKVGRSVLNGIIGDYLEKEESPLAIKMGFYHNGKRLNLDDAFEVQYEGVMTNKVVILVHGLTNLETIWDFPCDSTVQDGDSDNKHVVEFENYGSKLQRDFSYTPIFIRYNTGLAVKQNAQAFSDLICDLMRVYPIKIDDLVLIGFSMGGLLCRDAQRVALMEGAEWLKFLSRCIYIGSPHEGSPLEKFGYLTGEIFRQFPKEYLSHWADVIDVRSEGIKDLKHGLKEKGSGLNDDPCHSFVDTARHYFISGGVFESSYSFLNRFVGDSLVRQGSAKPSSAPRESLSAHFEGLSHIPLAHSERVYQQIREWIELEQTTQKIELVSLASRASYSDAKLNKSNDHGDSSTSELIAGTVDLLVSGFSGVVKTVETIHYSISEENFSKANRFPVISQFSYPVEQIHKGVSASVFSSLRFGGRAVQKFAKDVSAMAEKKTSSD